MKPVPKFKAKAVEGRLAFNNLEQFSKYLYTLEGNDLSVVVRKWRKDRSNLQNSYLWGVVYDGLHKWSGNDPDSIHSAMKMRFLRKWIVMRTWTGEYDDDHQKVFVEREIETVGSTRKLNTVEFNDYCNKIKTMASMDYGVFIPDPNQVDWLPEE